MTVKSSIERVEIAREELRIAVERLRITDRDCEREIHLFSRQKRIYGKGHEYRRVATAIKGVEIARTRVKTATEELKEADGAYEQILARAARNERKITEEELYKEGWRLVAEKKVTEKRGETNKPREDGWVLAEEVSVTETEYLEDWEKEIEDEDRVFVLGKGFVTREKGTIDGPRKLTKVETSKRTNRDSQRRERPPGPTKFPKQQEATYQPTPAVRWEPCPFLLPAPLSDLGV